MEYLWSNRMGAIETLAKAYTRKRGLGVDAYIFQKGSALESTPYMTFLKLYEVPNSRSMGEVIWVLNTCKRVLNDRVAVLWPRNGKLFDNIDNLDGFSAAFHLHNEVLITRDMIRAISKLLIDEISTTSCSPLNKVKIARALPSIDHFLSTVIPGILVRVEHFICYCVERSVRALVSGNPGGLISKSTRNSQNLILAQLNGTTAAASIWESLSQRLPKSHGAPSSSAHHVANPTRTSYSTPLFAVLDSALLSPLLLIAKTHCSSPTATTSLPSSSHRCIGLSANAIIHAVLDEVLRLRFEPTTSEKRGDRFSEEENGVVSRFLSAEAHAVRDWVVGVRDALASGVASSHLDHRSQPSRLLPDHEPWARLNAVLNVLEVSVSSESIDSAREALRRHLLQERASPDQNRAPNHLPGLSASLSPLELEKWIRIARGTPFGVVAQQQHQDTVAGGRRSEGAADLYAATVEQIPNLFLFCLNCLRSNKKRRNKRKGTVAPAAPNLIVDVGDI